MCFSDIFTFKRHSVGLTMNLCEIRAINILIYKKKNRCNKKSRGTVVFGQKRNTFRLFRSIFTCKSIDEQQI